MELVRTIPKRADLGGKDPDNIIELCNEVRNLKFETSVFFMFIFACTEVRFYIIL